VARFPIVLVMSFSLFVLGAMAQTQTGEAIMEQLTLLKDNQLDVFALNDDEVDQLINAINQEVLDDHLKLYPDNNYYTEFPWKRGLLCSENDKQARVLARLYLRRGEDDPVKYQDTYDALLGSLLDYIPDEMRPPELSTIDFDALAHDTEALQALLISMIEMDQYLVMRHYESEAYAKLTAIIEGDHNRREAFEALLRPSKCRYIRQLGHIAEQILRSQGWPDPKTTGDQASLALWLIIQHQDENPELQAYALPILKQAVEDLGVKPAHYAYLEDRINTNHGRKQRFGTQLFDCGETTLVNASKVDQWRAEYGLGSISEYRAQPWAAHLGCDVVDLQ